MVPIRPLPLQYRTFIRCRGCSEESSRPRPNTGHAGLGERFTLRAGRGELRAVSAPGQIRQDSVSRNAPAVGRLSRNLGRAGRPTRRCPVSYRMSSRFACLHSQRFSVISPREGPRQVRQWSPQSRTSGVIVSRFRRPQVVLVYDADVRDGSWLCENAKTLNRDRRSYSSKTASGLQFPSAFTLEIKRENVLLVAF